MVVQYIRTDWAYQLVKVEAGIVELHCVLLVAMAVVSFVELENEPVVEKAVGDCRMGESAVDSPAAASAGWEARIGIDCSAECCDRMGTQSCVVAPAVHSSAGECLAFSVE